MPHDYRQGSGTSHEFERQAVPGPHGTGWTHWQHPRGRRALLTLSISLIGASTLILGLLPTYEQIGLAAPLLLMAMRVVQGFSLGGEFTGSMVYTTELSSPLIRGLVSSSTAAGVTLGFIMGAATGGLINATLTPDQVNAWGWRIPFVGSVLFLIVGYFLRRGIAETEEGQKAQQERSSVLASLIADWRPIVQTFGIVDMAINQGGCFETSRPTTHANRLTSSTASFTIASPTCRARCRARRLLRSTTRRCLMPLELAGSGTGKA